MDFETVIGLEVHCELSTETKIFCSCKTSFGEEPNTNICPVCTGFPGVLPVLNKKVLEYSIKAGLVLNCEIAETIVFDRKNYFYPDLPKAYQISQLYAPLCREGYINVNTEEGDKKIRIREIHMEEDAGKLIHSSEDERTLIDYNRAGVPLIEIVTYPDFSCAEEVLDFLTKLKAILLYTGVCDCKMQEGSLRVDVNLSVKEKNAESLGERTETKNLNSFKAVKKAIEFEENRQKNEILKGNIISCDTIHWDDARGIGFVMRPKESIEEYRYFNDPDLPEQLISREWAEEIRKSIPELPSQRENRYINEYNLTEYEAKIICASKALSDVFEKLCVLTENPKESSNWILGEVSRLYSVIGKEPEDYSFSTEKLAFIINKLGDRGINRNTAKELFEKVFLDDADPEKIIKEEGLEIINDESSIEEAVRKVLSENEKSVEELKAGKNKVEKFLIGMTMKELKGKGDPRKIIEIMKKEIEKL